MIEKIEDIEITEAMIEAGAREVDRLINFDTESPAWIGPYTCEAIAKMVFQRMLASRRA